jgi:prevent-host-death family protein
MKEVTISKFRAPCSALIREVETTGKPLRIISRGKPLAEIVPLKRNSKSRKLGRMAGKGKILGDIVSPVIDLNDIEAYRD